MKHPIDKAMRSVNAMYGDGSITTGAQLAVTDRFPTCSPDFNAAIGGGVPRGGIVEIFGEPSTGKTALALEIARAGGAALYITAEGKPSSYEVKGCPGLYVALAETLEDALGMIEIAADAFDVVVLDSLAAFPTKQDKLSRLSETVDSDNGKVFSSLLPRLVPLLAAQGCTLVIVNQLREKIGVFFEDSAHAPGGRALKYFAALRLRTNSLQYYRKGQEAAAALMRVRVEKNKLGAPLRTADLLNDFGVGLLPVCRGSMALLA